MHRLSVRVFSMFSKIINFQDFWAQGPWGPGPMVQGPWGPWDPAWGLGKATYSQAKLPTVRHAPNNRILCTQQPHTCTQPIHRHAPKRHRHASRSVAILAQAPKSSLLPLAWGVGGGLPCYPQISAQILPSTIVCCMFYP